MSAFQPKYCRVSLLMQGFISIWFTIDNIDKFHLKHLDGNCQTRDKNIHGLRSMEWFGLGYSIVFHLKTKSICNVIGMSILSTK